jgi:hypothetical protein
MGDVPSAALKLPRRIRLHHPFLAVVSWLGGLILIGEGTAIYLALTYSLGLGHLPAVNCLAGIAVGLAFGVVIAVEERWRLGRWLEVEARALASGDTPLWLRLLRALPSTAILASALGVLYLVLRPAGGPIFLAAMGSFFVPSIFLYHAYARVYSRARQLFLESTAAGATLAATPSQRGRLAPWINPLGVISIMGVLGLGAWLQWGPLTLGESQPRTYETEEYLSGIATRLTYGGDATDPALSPDGRFIAYRKEIGVFNARLEIMRTDGSQKRAVTPESGPSPAFCTSINWSPDGKRILLAGGRPWRPTKSWLETSERYSPPSDLWVVDVATGAAQRLTTDDNYVAGIWLPAAREIAAVRDTRSGKWLRLWLMDEDGGRRHEVDQVKLLRGGSPQPWHGGRDVVVVGTEDSTGIWSVNTATAEAARIADMKAWFALPLNDRWLLVAVPGQPSPPFRGAASIGVLDASTGKVHWVVRDIQGSLSHLSLAAKAGVVVFSLRLDDDQNLWALRLKDGRIEKLTRDQQVWRTTIEPSGKAVFYQAFNPESTDRSLWGLGEAIWRLNPGRPLGAG